MNDKKRGFDDYVSVAERIEKFYQKYPEGRIITHIVEHDSERGFILMRAEGYRAPDDAQPAATGHAFELRSEGLVNAKSYIENCESSACGRMLALLGFEAKRTTPSRVGAQKERGPQRENATGPTVSNPPRPQGSKWFDECTSLIAQLKQAGDADFIDTKALTAHIRRTASTHRWIGMIGELADLTEERLEVYAGVLTDKLAAIHS